MPYFYQDSDKSLTWLKCNALLYSNVKLVSNLILKFGYTEEQLTGVQYVNFSGLQVFTI